MTEQGKAARNQGGNLTLSRVNPPTLHQCPSPFSVGTLVFLFGLCALPPLHANTNENTTRPSVISLFTIPTVISGHGNGILVHDQGSSDTPLTLLPKINTCQLLVLSLRCFAQRNLNVFDKGKRLGIYFLKLGCQAAHPDAAYRGQYGSKLPVWPRISIDQRASIFGCVYFVMREFHSQCSLLH